MVGAAVFYRLLNHLWIESQPRAGSAVRSGRGAVAHAVGSHVEQCYARSYRAVERRWEVAESLVAQPVSRVKAEK